MGHTGNNHTSVARRRPMMTVAAHAHVLIGIVLLSSLIVLAGCGQPVVAGTSTATPTPTLTPTPTRTPTPTLTPTPTSVATGLTCQPDDFGIYSSQTGYVTTLSDAPLAAPPQTKHGIGSSGNNGTVAQGGESGVCTIGTFASVTTFYNQQLSSMGWQYSAPPAALGPCFHGTVPAQVWWKGSDTFSWYDGGSAGGGSIFWSYGYCTAH